MIYLSPNIKKETKPRPSSIQDPKKLTQAQLALERQLFAMGMSKKSYQMFEAVTMIALGIFSIAFTRNVFAALISAYTGKHILQMYISYKASKKINLIDSQTLQFVRGIADNIELGEIIFNAVKYSGLQLKEPLRSVIMRAVNKSFGENLISDNIRALSDELKTPIYKELGSVLEKGLNEGATQISYAVRKLEEKLQEGENVARKRSDIIGAFILFVLFMFLICLLSPMLLLIKYPIWEEAINNVNNIFVVGSLLTLFMAQRLKKYIKMFFERSEAL